MSNPIKELRKQLRTITKEELPEILKNALFQAAVDQIQKQMHERLDKIEEDQKKLMMYLLRQGAQSTISKK